MNGENFLSKQQTTKGQTVMKDIDGQEIHVGDVVLILPYQAAFYKTTIGKVVNVDANIIVKFPKFIMTSCFKPEEIFCLFYRKPTTSTVIYWKYIGSNGLSDTPFPLHKVENGKSFVWTYTNYRPYVNFPSSPLWKQLTEDEAKALVPEAFKA